MFSVMFLLPCPVVVCFLKLLSVNAKKENQSTGISDQSLQHTSSEEQLYLEDAPFHLKNYAYLKLD